MSTETAKVGKRGTVVIPASLRRELGIEEGSFVIMELVEGCVVMRPAAVMPLEVYSPERKAEFLLANAVDAQDYERAAEEVRKLGLNPDKIEHSRPAGV